MASRLSIQLPRLFHSKSLGSENRIKITTNAPYTPKFNAYERGNNGLSKSNLSLGLLFTSYASSSWFSLRALSSTTSSAPSDETDGENGLPVAKAHGRELEFNRVSCLEWVLHESARSFSLVIQSLELAESGPELAMAWAGVDVHAWHKCIAYQVAVYALLKSAMEVEFLLSREHCNDPSLVRDILLPKINLVGEYIESQLNMRHPNLVQWFRMEEMPRIAGCFIPLLQKWFVEYAGSGVAGIILTISCCTAVEKLGSGRVSSPQVTWSIEDVFVELMNLSHSLVSVDKLHHLAIEAGFEEEFLSYFGTKVLPKKRIQEVEFWIGLAQKKLSVAFHRESVNSGLETFHGKVEENTLATLGLFAFLGRRTRLFLSRMGIKDLDEQLKDFLSYLECGSLFIYPEFSSLSVYQHFMEVVIYEIGWLDFYAEFPCINNQERRRSKHHAIQAEKEIILSTVFTVCYDVFSGFAHFSNSTQQPINSNLLAFLLRSQSLLTVCLEDYWAAYDKAGELLKIAERGAFGPTLTLGTKGTIIVEAQQSSTFLMTTECQENIAQLGSDLRKWQATSSAGLDAISLAEASCAAESKSLHESLLRKSTIQLISTSTDIWMGSQLLFIDIMVSLDLLLKQLHGQNITKREREKIRRTVSDIASLIPVTILMLLPVSVVGHAAMFAAIKKYMPFLIPSPYSPERLDVVKQLKRTKNMKIHTWSNLEDASSRVL
ncbi:hypothetical protein L1049_003456 [Liquidambar formosana]|uniref:LETM1-like protein n=1 Tax=Liquidambar formosana TaxID=63359 RepID=A0AAP0N3A3_LIQFO